MSRKAQQEGKAVSIIIIIIAFSMVLYMVLIPPEERQELLEGEIGPGADSSTAETTPEIEELLSESPGRLSPLREYGTRHNINSVNLFVKTEPKFTNLADNINLKKSLFSKSAPKLRFDLEKIPDLKKVLLHLTIQDPKGVLKISVNDYEFFSKEIKEPGIQLIEIPLHYLKERNLIEFKVSTGILTANHYTLTDVGLKQEFERINSREQRTVVITENEKLNIQEAELNYYIYCNSPLKYETTNFRILLNNNPIHSSEIKCISTPRKVEIDQADLKQGTNELIFILEEGDFSLNQISLETTSDRLDYKTYYFTLPYEDFNYVRSDQKDIKLELLMEDDERDKQARIVINDGAFFMKTKEAKYELDLKDYAQQGTNFLRIQPSNEFHLLGLRVYLEE